MKPIVLPIGKAERRVDMSIDDSELPSGKTLPFKEDRGFEEVCKFRVKLTGQRIFNLPDSLRVYGPLVIPVTF